MPRRNSDSAKPSIPDIDALHFIADADWQFLEEPYRVVAEVLRAQLEINAPQIVAIAAMHAALDLVARLEYPDDYTFMRDQLERDLMPALESHRRYWLEFAERRAQEAG